MTNPVLLTSVFSETQIILRNSVSAKKHNIILNNFRVCNSTSDNLNVDAYINRENNTLVFLAKVNICANYILADSFSNLYKIIEPRFEVTKLFVDKESVVTIATFEPFIPSNPYRNSIDQYSQIKQTVEGMNFYNVNNLVLTIEQKAQIKQEISIGQFVESANDEMKYSYKPYKDREEFIQLIKDISAGLKSISALEDKIIDRVLNQASGLIKDLFEIMIEKIKNNNK